MVQSFPPFARHGAATPQPEASRIIPLIEPWLGTVDPFLCHHGGQVCDFIKDNNGNTRLASHSYVNSNVSWFDWSNTAGRNRWETNCMNWFTVNGFAVYGTIPMNRKAAMRFPITVCCMKDGRYGNVTGANADSRREWSNEHNYFGLRTAQTSFEALQKTYPNKRQS